MKKVNIKKTFTFKYLKLYPNASSCFEFLLSSLGWKIAKKDTTHLKTIPIHNKAESAMGQCHAPYLHKLI